MSGAKSKATIKAKPFGIDPDSVVRNGRYPWSIQPRTGRFVAETNSYCHHGSLLHADIRGADGHHRHTSGGQVKTMKFNHAIVIVSQIS